MPAPTPSPPPLSARLREFLDTEAAGGAVLVVAAIAALAWANSPWAAAYEDLARDTHTVVNEGLMTVFFFVVGLEIKRELAGGELSTWRKASLPAIAAVGGMVVPALIYAGFNAGQPGSGGWGIPMATDIAFAVGVLALLGDRVPSGLRIFLLSLAIADDVGAIAVIAIFYSGGVHPTVVGVVVGLLVPAARAERIEHRLHPFTSFAIVPLFALVNAGVRMDASAFTENGAITAGVVAGLVVGKLAGITIAARLAVALKVAELPTAVTWSHVAGVGAIAGIGFTVSLFIADLAFDDAALIDAAKVAILAASVIAAVVGVVALLAATRQGPSPPAG